MASFKAVVLKHQIRNDATFGIKIRLTHGRKSKYINTDLIVTKDDVTKSFKLKNHFFVDETDKIIKKYRDICNKNAATLKNLDIEQVFDLLTETEKLDGFFIDIVEYGRKKVDMLFGKKQKGTARNLQNAINNLIKFVGKEKIDINEITAKLV
ncbi:MAG: phage integrase SAM-like domain-containing protein, partial [Lentimicrobiaceae bacterium]|nr:phage integrase SAM-like domain-containing protein [Lentimicrobiaceae bacterium]